MELLLGIAIGLFTALIICSVIIAGLLSRCTYHSHKRKKEVTLIMALNIPDNATLEIKVGGAVDAEGASTTLPEGTTFAWEAVKTAGDDFGSLAVSDDNQSAVLSAGAAGSTGVVQVTATLPDGKTLTGVTDELDIVPGEAVSLGLIVGQPVVP
jgi:hypothetical protein